MTCTFRVDVLRGEKRLFSAIADGPIDIGRVDPSPTASPAEILGMPVQRADGTIRFPIAEVGDLAISRHQLVIRPVGSSTVEVTNVSKNRDTVVHCNGDGARLESGATTLLELPAALYVKLDRQGLVVSLGLPMVSSAPSLDETLVPVENTNLFVESAPPDRDRPPLGATLAVMDESSLGQLLGWWKYVIAVLQSASESDRFFDKAAEAVRSLVRLDVGAVYLWRCGVWEAVATSAAAGASKPSMSVLESVRVKKQTLRSRPGPELDVTKSQVLIDGYVASPILDGHGGSVIGALYGHRTRGRGGPLDSDITHLEALLVETLACGVATGLARVKEKERAIAEKVKFAQFFTPRLAAQLESQPDLLTGRDAEVSVLFCDVYGFSSVAEKVGTALTMEWIRDVLTVLSSKVVDTEGVLVDYVGDELMAMWGAPTAQHDHADRACWTARAMLEAMTTLDERWFSRIGANTSYRIGINSGPARVGNTGSEMKFKYGPLGNVVNLASRVRGATKYFKVDAIVTGDTRMSVSDRHPTRRLCGVSVINIDAPVQLHELDRGFDPARRDLFQRYEAGLEAFETRQLANATRILGHLIEDHPGDGPSLQLLARSVDAMVNPEKYEAVWKLPGK